MKPDKIFFTVLLSIGLGMCFAGIFGLFRVGFVGVLLCVVSVFEFMGMAFEKETKPKDVNEGGELK